MKYYFRQMCLWALPMFLMILVLAACSNNGGVQVTSRNFDDEVGLQQNLILSLNKELVPDSMLNVWDSTAYLDISPAVKGLYKWNSGSELVFSPTHGFRPGTAYTARLTKLLELHSKKKIGVDTKPILFHTAPLQVTATHLSWVRGQGNGNIMVQMDMSFNYDVDIAAAAAKLQLTNGNTNISVTEAGGGTGKVLSVQFMPLTNRDEETNINIRLGKGITVTGTDYVSAKDTSFTAIIPSRYNLSILGVVAQHNGTEGVITVSTSQPVQEANLKSMIALQPAVEVEVTANDGGFTITGSQLSPTQAYNLTINAALEGAFGGKMKGPHTEQITFGKLQPSISFTSSKGMYLSGAGYKNLSLSIVNVPAVEVSLVKVYENNLESFLRRGKDYGYNYDEDNEDGGSYQYYETGDFGDEIFKKVYETAKLPRRNAASLLKLDFEDRIKSYNGVYVLCVRSKDHNWVQDSRIISVSDIGLIVKAENDNVYVFANSIKNATALNGVSINFISTNNQKMYTATTDGEGVAVFRGISQQSPGFRVGMVTAKMGDEFTFVSLPHAQIGTSRFDVGGRLPNETNLNAFIYAERNLYRPGEELHVSTIIRDEQWATQPGMPVKIKLVSPNGREFGTVRRLLNEQGSCEAAFAPPPTAMTGTYTVQVLTGNDVLLNTYEISVEEFMPDRMKVGLTLNKQEMRPADGELIANIQADNLFGTPAADRNYHCELNLSKGEFSPEKFSAYSFALHNEFEYTPDMREGKTDATGKAEQRFTLAAALDNNGVLNGSVMASVFDETGRPVHRYGNFKVYTQPLFAGVRLPDQYVTTRQPLTIGLVALDKAENPQNTELQVTLVKKEWHNVIRQSGNSYQYVSQSEERVLSQQKIRVSGPNTPFLLTPQESGEYELRVALPGANNYVSAPFYAYGWNDTKYSSFEVDNEGHVDIKADKKEYNVGEQVEVLFTTPFEGRMLVTLERNKVLKHYYLATKGKTATLTFTADEAMLPNVYITATLFRPMDGSDMPLTVAHGFQSVKVEQKGNLMPVKIEVVEKSRSKTKQTIRLKTMPGAFVTIAAVDEGILQVKDFATPDPYAHFYQKMALTVNTYDIYPWLLPEIKTTLSSTGGDGASKAGLRMNPMFVNRVKNVSFWSGILQADGSGRVAYDIDIPQFSGEIRVMAAVYKHKAFGQAEQHMKVADPIVISTALPRFLSPKDEAVVPVSLSNTTNNSATATITMTTTGPLGVAGSETQTISIPANREGRAVYRVVARPAIGAAKVTVTVKALGETFTNATDISVRPPASLQKITGSGFAPANTTTALDMGNNFLPSSVAGRLVVGKSPLTEFSKNLDDLVCYPHGCVEQTTSAAFPQLYYADLVKSMNGHVNADLNPAYNVQAAINKLQAMQQGNGGLSYWPEGGEVSWWGSIYAAHFLLEARKAGYEVNQRSLDRLVQYMKYRLDKKETFTYFYNGKQKKEIAPKEVPYSLYVLAKAGQVQQPSMNYYKAHQALLSLDGRYLLSAAYALSGQPMQAREVLPTSFSGEVADRVTGGSFYSPIRDLALALNVLVDTDPRQQQVGVMARMLAEALKKERYPSTQDNVFSILALGKIARIAEQTVATATITAGGKTLATTQGQPVTIDMKNYAGSQPGVQVKGKGGYYYFWQMSGITADGSYKEEDSYLKVRRTYLDRNGREMGNNFKQNDLVIVRLTIETANDITVENIAITDMLPACLEIENTRLTEMPDMKWLTEKEEPQYTDIRDDRITMYATAGKLRKSYYYMARAVSPGTYQLGPVMADAMYDGTYHSYHGAGVVKVE